MEQVRSIFDALDNQLIHDALTTLETHARNRDEGKLSEVKKALSRFVDSFSLSSEDYHERWGRATNARRALQEVCVITSFMRQRRDSEG